MQRIFSSFKTLGTAAVVAGIVNEFCLYDVDAGTRAVIFDKVRGLQDKCVGEGTHFRLPFFQVPIVMDIRARPRIIHSATGTKDLQMVNISVRMLMRPEESQLPKIYESLGIDFDEKVLPSLGNEVLKAVVAHYNAEELLSKRGAVSSQIYSALVDRAAKFGIILDDVAITHLTFGKEFARAIENKQVAQQEAETQQYLVLKADQERLAAIIRAEGEAEAAQLISHAVNTCGNGLIEVRRIDAAKEVASILARGDNHNITFLPSSSSGSNILLGVNSK